MAEHRWSNYETWLVNHWLHKDESNRTILKKLIEDGNRLQEFHKGQKDHTGFEQDEKADAIEAFVREWCFLDVQGESLAHELLGAALGDVDWQEIAKVNEE